MSLREWKKNGWLRDHRSSPQEIRGLFDIVQRDLLDAQTSALSDDWRFGIAYNAALKLCSILLVAEGFRPDKNLAHYRTLQAMPLILGQHKRNDAEYLDVCRVKRNTVEYNCTGAVTAQDANELIHFAEELRSEVNTWIVARHPELIE
jgi:uncharacterized protein (UPF0332 family)